MSSGTRPDLGGLEEDDNYFADEHVNPEIITPGCFRNYCVEIEMGQLAVNTVLQHVTKIEDTILSMFNNI
jgi:DNA polymerase epsilon subunit 1